MKSLGNVRARTNVGPGTNSYAPARHALATKWRGAKKRGLNNPLYERPGFLLWRARHIANSIFTYECREFGVTSPQYLVLAVVKETPGTDQMGVSRIAGLDRFTTSFVLSNLIRRKLIARERSTKDRRRYRLHLTRAGDEILKRIIPGATRARTRLLSPFSPREQKIFVAMLQRLVTALNSDARARVDEEDLPYTHSTAGRSAKRS